MLHHQLGALSVRNVDVGPGSVGVGINENRGDRVLTKNVKHFRGKQPEAETAVEPGTAHKPIKTLGMIPNVYESRTQAIIAEMRFDVINDLEIHAARDRAERRGVNDSDGLAALLGKNLTAPTGAIAHFLDGPQYSLTGLLFDGSNSARVPIDRLTDC